MSEFAPVKIIYFSVKLPDDKKDLEDEYILSKEFIIKTKDDKETKWNIVCNLQDAGGAQVSLYLLRLTAAETIDFDVKFIESLVSVNLEEDSFVNEISVTPEELKKDTKYGRKIFISHEELYSKPSSYFPDGHLHFKVKIFTKDLAKLTESNSNVILGHFSDLFGSKKHADFIFQASDEIEIQAHKAILCARSEVFDAMMSDKFNEKDEGMVEIADFDSVVVTELLRFIYCEKVEKIEEIDIELYKIAEKYDIKGLPELCLKSIYLRLDETNVVDIAIFADLFDATERKTFADLFMRCVLIIEAKYSIVSKTFEWINLDNKLKCKILEIIVKRSELEKLTREISLKD